MSADPETDIYLAIPKPFTGVADENLQLAQIYEKWQQTDFDNRSLASAVEACQATSDPTELLRVTAGHLVKMAQDKRPEAPMAAFGRARAAIVNLVLRMPAGFESEEELFDRILDSAQDGIDSPIHNVMPESPATETASRHSDTGRERAALSPYQSLHDRLARLEPSSEPKDEAKLKNSSRYTKSLRYIQLPGYVDSFPTVDLVRVIQSDLTPPAEKEQAFEVLNKKFSKPLTDFLANTVFKTDKYLASDGAQDALLKIYVRIGKYKLGHLDSFTHWAEHIAYNAGVDLIRKRKREVIVENVYGDYVSNETGVNDERCVELWSALRELPFDQREVIVYGIIGGYSPEETANLLGKSVGSIHGLKHRGRKALQAILTPPQVRKPASDSAA